MIIHYKSFLHVASNAAFSKNKNLAALKCSVILICKPPTEMMSHFNYCFGLIGFH